MARIRSIKPEWLEDERLIAVGSDARVLSVALLLLADDHGRGRASEVILAGRVFPGDPDGLAKIRESLARLSGWYARLYEVRGQRYYAIRNWTKHQRVDKPGKPLCPGPDEAESPQETPSSRESRECLAIAPGTLAPETETDQETDQETEGTTRATRAASGSPKVTDHPKPTPAADLPPIEPNPVLDYTHLEREFNTARQLAGGGPFQMQFSEQKSAAAPGGVLDVLNAQPEPWVALRTALRNFIGATWTRDRGWNWRDFAGSDPGRWLVTQRSGKGAPAPNPDDFTDEEWGAVAPAGGVHG